ncbi:MAG TPA: hypothetical protein VIK78_22810, partial [Ruminiclostridium sp.]
MNVNYKSYNNFNIAIYFSNSAVKKAYDEQWLEKSYAAISKNIRIGKIYIETFRHGETADKEHIEKAIDFFRKKGIKQISGGMMVNASKSGPFRRSFCFTDPSEREQFRQLVEYTASLFDEIIFDDMFTFNCRCQKCQAAKGEMSWTEYRLKTMEGVYSDLVMKTAKSVNPNCDIIIKYPNWYEQYQFAGYNLEAGPRLFDHYYAGTETRDSDNTTQHLQIYQSYNIMRYFDHLRPGHFNGGWVDPGSPGSWNRFAQQFDLTLFAKPKETTIWDYDFLLDYIKDENGEKNILSISSAIAGDSFEKVDSFLGELGNPYGVASYKPYQSFGESYIHNYLGMIGIPIDLFPEFPEASKVVFLSQQASYDQDIVGKIKKFLAEGKRVIITSQLYKALLSRGIKNIVEFDYTDKKISTSQFVFRESMNGEPNNIYYSENPIIFNEIYYGLTEAEETIQCVVGNNRYPLALTIRGYEKGDFYVINMPDNIGDLYNLPREVISAIRHIFMTEIPVAYDAPAQVSLFVYDNNTF